MENKSKTMLSIYVERIKEYAKKGYGYDSREVQGLSIAQMAAALSMIVDILNERLPRVTEEE